MMRRPAARRAPGCVSVRSRSGAFQCLRLPPIPAGSFATSDGEANQPRDEGDDGHDPQAMDGEAQTPEQKDQEQDEKEDTHQTTSSSRTTRRPAGPVLS